MGTHIHAFFFFAKFFCCYFWEPFDWLGDHIYKGESNYDGLKDKWSDDKEKIL